MQSQLRLQCRHRLKTQPCVQSRYKLSNWATVNPKFKYRNFKLILRTLNLVDLKEKRHLHQNMEQKKVKTIKLFLSKVRLEKYLEVWVWVCCKTSLLFLYLLAI